MAKREIDEIEVDLTAPKPLNKKQKRLLKKGKIDEPEPEDPTKKQPKPRSQYCVWIGNLSFETSGDALRQFLVRQTSGSKAPVLAEDITRLKMPPKKGFAYVDVRTEEQMQSIVSLSETRLDQRNLLIKDARSFEGRPEKDRQNHAASRILFVGNLSFDTTDTDLEMHFQHCGEISRIRTATFMDTGKCKGFSFIDFTAEEAATKALKDPRCKRLGGRTLRMEYGEDRSQRRPKRDPATDVPAGAESDQLAPSQPAAAPPKLAARSDQAQRSERPGYPSRPSHSGRSEQSDRSERPERTGRSERSERPPKMKSRPTPGEALSNAQRAKQSVLPSAGKKVTFD